MLINNKEVVVSNKLNLVTRMLVGDIEVCRKGKLFGFSKDSKKNPFSSDMEVALKNLKDRDLAELIKKAFQLCNFTKGELRKLLPKFDITYDI